MVLLMTFTVAFMPIVLPILLPTAHVSAWHVAKLLLTLTLIPLCIGLLLRARKEAFARVYEPYFRHASTVFLILVILLVFAANYHKVVRTVGLNAIVAGTLLVVLSFGCGFVLGGQATDKSSVQAFGTAQRDISAALAVAVENFPDSDVVVMLIVVALLGLCLQVPIAICFGRRLKVHR